MALVLSTELLDLEDEMQHEYTRMYGTPDQDPDNSMFTAEGVVTAQLDGELVGFCAWGRWPNGDGKVRALYVTPAHRGKGLSRGLLTAAEKVMKAHGISYVRFETGPKQTPAMFLYESHGYSRLSEGFGFYAENEGSVFYGRSL